MFSKKPFGHFKLVKFYFSTLLVFHVVQKHLCFEGIMLILTKKYGRVFLLFCLLEGFNVPLA